MPVIIPPSVISPLRTWLIAKEDRLFKAPAEDRLFKVQAETRLHTVKNIQ